MGYRPSRATFAPAAPSPPPMTVRFNRHVSDEQAAAFMEEYLRSGITLHPSDHLPPDIPGFPPGYPTHPQHREVVTCEAGWTVTHSDFTSTDKVLATAVATELDRIEPLPWWRPDPA